MNASDPELLQQFVQDGSEDAFTELLHRHVDLVFSAALRQVGFNAQSAEDVTQTVFTELARKARQVSQHPTLTGWLYSTTRRAAAHHHRSESRRLARETAAHALEATVVPGETAWVTLGGGYRVTGRLRLPAGFTLPPGARLLAQLRSSLPDPPPDFGHDPSVLQTPERQELARHSKLIPLALQPDGSFIAESVTGGNYHLTVMLLSAFNPSSGVPPRLDPLFRAKREVTVPGEPAVGAINLGEVATEVSTETP